MYLDSLDDKVKIEVEKLLGSSSEIEVVWLTMLAIYVLENTFAEFEDEWRLIGKKGYEYLKSKGIEKPD